MPTQKLYAGAKLRETRQRLGLTQKDFAVKLGVSLPYLNQMEKKRVEHLPYGKNYAKPHFLRSKQAITDKKSLGLVWNRTL